MIPVKGTTMSLSAALASLKDRNGNKIQFIKDENNDNRYSGQGSDNRIYYLEISSDPQVTVNIVNPK